jgi:hypothetical protein
MLGRSGQFEMCCDASPYAIVRACEQCGFCSPLDVRWCRISHFLRGEGQREGNFGLRLWGWVFGRGRRKPTTCTCGQSLPDLKQYGFTCLSRKVGDYLLGQCRRCRTVFWDVPPPVPAWMEEGEVRFTDLWEM